MSKEEFAEYTATRYAAHVAVREKRRADVALWAETYAKRESIPRGARIPDGTLLRSQEPWVGWCLAVEGGNPGPGLLYVRRFGRRGNETTVRVDIALLQRATVDVRTLLPAPWFASIAWASDDEWEGCPLVQQLRYGVTPSNNWPAVEGRCINPTLVRHDFPNALGHVVETPAGTYRVVDVVYPRRNGPDFCVRHPDGRKTWEKLHRFKLLGTCTNQGKIETPADLAYRRLQQFPQVPKGFTRSRWVNGLTSRFENGQKVLTDCCDVDSYFFRPEIPWVDRDGILVGPDRTYHWLVDNATIQEAPRVR